MLRRLDVLVRQLGDVHQALDPFADADERAERDELRHLAFEDLVRGVLARELVPRVLLLLLQG